MWTAGRIVIAATDYKEQIQACALAANFSMYVRCIEEQFWCVLYLSTKLRGVGHKRHFSTHVAHSRIAKFLALNLQVGFKGGYIYIYIYWKTAYIYTLCIQQGNLKYT